MSKDILSAIQGSMGSFSKGQKLIARFILESYDKAAFMTASKLGRTVNVSESTVVRFAAELGYDGYPAMQKALQEMIRSKLTSVQRIEVSNDRIGNQDILSIVMQSAIVSARHIYILGVRSAAALSSFLGFYFNLIFDNVTMVSATSTSEIFEQLLRIGPGDVILGVSFPRYSRRTVKAMEFSRNRGAETIAITDSETSPLTATATLTLLAKSDMASFVDSLVAPLSLVNALIVSIGRRKNEDLSQTFAALEQMWDEYEVYEKVEGPRTWW